MLYNEQLVLTGELDDVGLQLELIVDQVIEWD
jgi:hypothetical protein